MREIKFRAWDPDKKTMYVPEWIDGKFGEPWHQIWQDDAVFPDGKNIVVMQ